MDFNKFDKLTVWAASLPENGKPGENEKGEFCLVTGVFNGKKTERLASDLKQFLFSLPSEKRSRLRLLEITTKTVRELRETLNSITCDPVFLQEKISLLSKNIQVRLAKPFLSQTEFTHFVDDCRAQISSFLKHCQASPYQAEFATKLQCMAALLTLDARNPEQSDAYKETADIINGQIAHFIDPLPINFIELHTPKENDGPPFYMEPQKMNFCPFHAVNAFFGEPIISLTGSGKPMDGTEVLTHLSEALKMLQPTSGITANDITFTIAHMSKELTQDLDCLKSDRIVICPALTSHFVCFRRGKDGQWHKLDSDRYSHDQECDSPSHYLNRIYHQGCTVDDSLVTLIHLNNEKLTTGFE